MEKSEIVTRLSQLRQTLEQETGQVVGQEASSIITALPAVINLTPAGREFLSEAGSNGKLVVSSVPVVQIRAAPG